MLYNRKEKQFINIENFYKLDYRNYNVYYSGLIYLAQGIKAGKPSIDIIIQQYEKGDISFRDIYGIYVILIENKEDKSIYMFSDNSGMTTSFYTEQFISDNFTEIARTMKNPKLYKKMICEYLTLSRGYYLETFMEEVQMLEASCYYEVQGEQLMKHSKKNGYLGDRSKLADIPSFFADMAKSLSGLKVVSALTGGYDSRMVVASLWKKLEFDLFISGNNLKSREIQLSKRAADSIQKELKILSPDMKMIEKEEIIEQTFENSGGRACTNSSGLYRVDYFQKELQRQGYEVLLTGDAGDMYKDLWYKQEYPFYHKKSTNTRLFYATRMEPANNAVFLGNDLLECYRNQRKNMIRELEKRKYGLAVKSYESYGYRIAWEKGAFSHSLGKGMITYSPLQELELVKYSFLQPIHMKRFNRLQRKIITERSRNLAKVPTTNGTNASLDAFSICKDSWIESVGQVKRLVRGVRRKLGDREKTMAKVMLEDDADLRELSLGRQAVKYCQRVGYIKPGLAIRDIPIALLYKIIYIYQLETAINRE